MEFYYKEKLYDTMKTDIKGKVVAPNGPMKEGYDFLGWEIDGTTYPYRTIMVTKNSKAYAKFQITSYELTVNYNKDFGDVTGISNEKVKYDSTITLKAIPKEKYNFSGFKIIFENGSVTKTENPYTFNMPAKDVKIETSFKPKKTTVTFNTNGAKETLENETYLYKDMISLPQVTKDHYVFKGWEYNGSFFETKKSFFWDFTEKTLTFNAVWEIEKHKISVSSNDDVKGLATIGKIYNIYYDYNGAEKISGKTEDTYALGKKFYYNYAKANKNGEEQFLVGWFFDSNCTLPFTNDSVINSDTTLYAKWETHDTYLHCDDSKTFTFIAQSSAIYDIYFSSLNENFVSFDISTGEGTLAKIKYELYDGTTKIQNNELSLSDKNKTLTFDNLNEGTTYHIKIKLIVPPQNKKEIGIRQIANVKEEKTRFDYGEEIIVTATKKSGSFAGWYQDGIFKSDKLEYTFILSKDTTLVAKWN